MNEDECSDARSTEESKGGQPATGQAPSQQCDMCGSYRPIVGPVERCGIKDPVSGTKFVRRYGSQQLAPHEQWVVGALEPVLNEVTHFALWCFCCVVFCDALCAQVFGPNKLELTYSLWLPETTSDKDEIVKLLACHMDSGPEFCNSCGVGRVRVRRC